MRAGSAIRVLAGIIVAGVLLSGCAQSGRQREECDCGRGSAEATGLKDRRQVLSEGYSLLYRDSTSLARSDLLLLVKEESDAVQAVLEAVAAWGEAFRADLERIDRDYPGVRLDLDPLPEMEKRKREAIARDRVKEFAPVVGAGGREYERTLLIGLMNGLNHERHLCRVMAEEEPEPALKRVLEDAEIHYGRLYERIVGLLEARYFAGAAAGR